MNCPECGSKILSGHRYCSVCGYELSPEEMASSRKKGGGSKKWLAVIPVVVLVAAIGFLAPKLLHKSDSGQTDGGMVQLATAAPTTQAATAVPTAQPATATPEPVATATPEPVALVNPGVVATAPPMAPTRVRSQSDLYAVVNYMRDWGLTELPLEEFSLSDEEAGPVINSYWGIVSWGRSYPLVEISIEWCPGKRIWHAISNGRLDTLDARDQRIAQEAQNVVDALITPGMSDLQKEIALHDYIIYHADYMTDQVPDVESVYGFFEQGYLICSGYADTFYLLGRMAGLEIESMAGVVLEDGISHAWSLIRLDGQWYAVDVTWDDPIGGNGENHVYLNLPHDVFQGNRSWEEQTMPDGVYAQAIDSNWYYSDLPRASDPDTALALVRDSMDRTGEALLILEGNLDGQAVLDRLAVYYQGSPSYEEIKEESWARIYRFSL